MITVLGSKGSAEWRAALAFKEAFASLWEDIETSPDDDVFIKTSCKIYGFSVQDLDLVIVCSFRGGRILHPLRPLPSEPSGFVVKKGLEVKNLVLAVEVKSHDPRGVRFEGNSAFVKYTDKNGDIKWHDATEQSMKQAHTLRGYASANFGSSPFVANLIYFENLEESDLPRRPHNFIAGKFGGRALLTAIAEINKPWLKNGFDVPSLSSSKSQTITQLLSAPIFKPLAPTAIDRQRMERISKRLGLNDELYAALGQKLLILRGRGGTGKTVQLLQMAHKAYEENGARTLILTYNLALVADMRRLVALMGIPGSSFDGGIRIESIMSFMREMLLTFGLLDENEDFFSQYCSACSQLACALKEGIFTKPEIEEVLSQNLSRFSFDYLMADEGQDWPINEIEILRTCFPATKFVVADGVDQLIRGTRSTWDANLAVQNKKVFPLKACFRLKRNIAIFANALAARLGLVDWHVEPSQEALGGRIIIVQGSVAGIPELFHRTLFEAENKGNHPIDSLCCLPPWNAAFDKNEHSITSPSVALLESLGIQVWDGTKADIRKDIPRDLKELRIVQYDSCRGLEGWNVYCLGLDDLFNHKYKLSLEGARTRNDSLIPDSDFAHAEAARWVMIAITRAMDTLIIEDNGNCPIITKALEEIKMTQPDLIDWYKPLT